MLDSKESRVSAIFSIIESGNVLIPATVNWKEDFLLECMNFTLHKNDDQVDAMAQAILRFESTKKRSVLFGRHTIVG